MSADHLGLAGPAVPAARVDLIGLGYRAPRAAPPDGSARWRSALSFVCVGRRADLAARRRPRCHRELTSTLWNYAVSAGLDAKLAILVDPLSVFMILVVSGVSTLIHLYSVSYMKSDEGYRRYFATSTTSSSRCCCWCWPATSCC